MELYGGGRSGGVAMAVFMVLLVTLLRYEYLMSYSFIQAYVNKHTNDIPQKNDNSISL